MGCHEPWLAEEMEYIARLSILQQRQTVGDKQVPESRDMKCFPKVGNYHTVQAQRCPWRLDPIYIQREVCVCCATKEHKSIQLT